MMKNKRNEWRKRKMKIKRKSWMQKNVEDKLKKGEENEKGKNKEEMKG